MVFRNFMSGANKAQQPAAIRSFQTFRRQSVAPRQSFQSFAWGGLIRRATAVDQSNQRVSSGDWSQRPAGVTFNADPMAMAQTSVAVQPTQPGDGGTQLTAQAQGISNPSANTRRAGWGNAFIA